MKLAPVVTLLAGALAVLPAAALPAGQGKTRCRAGELRPVETATAAYAAVAKRALDAHSSPDGSTLRRFGKLNDNGYPTTFSIVGAVMTGSCRASWYQVKLPMRPNGSVGYVRAGDVLVQKVTTRIEIDLSRRELSYYRGNLRVLRARVAVGAPATPTPTGRFYVDQRVLPTDPKGPYGPAALGVSAYSDVLTGWTQGGPIGIHGTNQPWSIGRAVSNGCIRMPNRLIEKIFRWTVGGTPVIIHP